jgi:hypothetical protein
MTSAHGEAQNAAKRTNGFHRLYLHISAVAGALSIADLAEHVIKLRGIVKSIVDAWASVAGPIADALFGWVRLRFEVEFPAFMEDYLLAGLVLSAGVVRYAISATTRHWRTAGEFGWSNIFAATFEFLAAVLLGPFLLVLVVLGWPFLVFAAFILLYASIFTRDKREEWVQFAYFTTAPMLYFVALVVVSHAGMTQSAH